MESSREVFWAAQEVYILNIFLPIIIGFFSIFQRSYSAICSRLFQDDILLWHLGGAENRLGHIATRLKTTFAVTLAHVRILARSLSWHNAFPPSLGYCTAFPGQNSEAFFLPCGINRSSTEYLFIRLMDI